MHDIYSSANDEQKEYLKKLFGRDIFKTHDVKERIRTFEDACAELGYDHPLVAEYRTLIANQNDLSIYLEVFLKLRIIVAALNEGWIPRFTENECRYYPSFELYTKEEYDKLPENQKKDVWLWGGSSYVGSSCGLAYSYSSYAWSVAASYISARLALKSGELADYCGKQFVDLWACYILG